MKPAPRMALVASGIALVGVRVGDARAPDEGDRTATTVVQAERLEFTVPDIRFVGVRDLAVVDDGVWVLDSEEPFVTFVSRDGATVRRFGAEGQGPSELLNPLGLDAVGSRRAAVRVWDIGNARMTEFDARGSVLETHPLGGTSMGGVRKDIRQVSYVDPFRVRRVGDDYVVARYPHRASRTADFLSGTLVRTDPTLEELSPILAFSSDAVRAVAERVSLEFTAVPLWDGCESLLVTWLPERGTVQWVDLAGGLRHETAVPVEPREVTLDDVEAYVRRMARLELGPNWEDHVRDTRAVARQMRGQFAIHAPVATELRCGTDGSAWLRTFDTEASPLGLGPDWLRVEMDGAITRLSFPEAFSPKAFLGDEAVGIWTEESGLQQLARWPAPRAVLMAAAGQ